jgi:uncharacterized protein YjbJ (UPF0337 family)
VTCLHDVTGAAANAPGVLTCGGTDWGRDASFPDTFRWTCGSRDAPRCRPTGRRVSTELDHEREDVLMSGEDKANNKVEELGGKAKEALGNATGDKDLQAAGQKDQTKSNLKQAGEKVKDAFK